MTAVSIPVVVIGDLLLVSLRGEVDDKTALALQDDIARTLAETAARGVVLDLSGVELVDSFLARVLAQIGSCARLLAAEAVVAGMRAAVAITLAEMGLDLPGLRTTRTAGEALDLLSRRPGEPRGPR